MKYYAQPDYNARQVQIYALPSGSAATLQTTVSLASASQGPNDVVLYQSPAGSKMFVSYDLGSSGLIEIYDFTNDILPHLGTASISPTPISSIPVATSVVGMAIQPGTGNLFCATFNEGETIASEPGLTGNGGVIVFNAPGYAPAAATQFCDNNDNSVTKYCANLAFDECGNLWMTTWDDSYSIDNGVGNQFLVCYLNLNGVLAKTNFFLIGNLYKDAGGNTHPVTFSSRVVKLPPSPQSPPASLYALSAPEGIAFDPNGNLWLANNNDFVAINGSNNGTLVRIDRSWIAANLLNYTSIQAAAAAGANGVPLSLNIDATHYADNPLITVYFLYGAKFGGLVFDGCTLYAHDQDNGGTADAVVWNFDTTTYAASPVTFTKTAISTDYPGNGGSFLYNSTPAQLLIRDTATDSGTEPDTGAAGVLWESPDIAVNEQSSPVALPAANQPYNAAVVLGSGSIEHGQAAGIVVRVHNIGGVASTGTEVLKVYYAKASAGLSWPLPWDGSTFDTTATHPALGGFIGATEIGIISPGNETFFTVPWSNPPDSATFTVNDEHFCLLARIETTGVYPYGLDVAEETNLSSTVNPLGDNVAANRGIGWRNIAIVASAAPMGSPKAPPRPVPINVLGANYGHGTIHLQVQTLGGNGRLLAMQPPVAIHAPTGPIGGGPHPVLMLKKETAVAEPELSTMVHTTAPIQIAPHQILPLQVTVTPPADEPNYAVRVIQYATDNGAQKIVGGQTFVFGQVDGFPVRALPPKPVVPTPTPIQPKPPVPTPIQPKPPVLPKPIEPIPVHPILPKPVKPKQFI